MLSMPYSCGGLLRPFKALFFGFRSFYNIQDVLRWNLFAWWGTTDFLKRIVVGSLPFGQLPGGQEVAGPKSGVNLFQRLLLNFAADHLGAETRNQVDLCVLDNIMMRLSPIKTKGLRCCGYPILMTQESNFHKICHFDQKFLKISEICGWEKLL